MINEIKLLSRRISIRASVVSVVLFATLITSGISVAVQYYFSRQIAMDSAIASYKLAAQNTSEFVETIDTRTVQVAQVLSKFPGLLDGGEGFPQMRSLFAEVMRNNPIYYSIYLGFPNGNFYEVVNLNDKKVDRRTPLHAQPNDSWVVNTVSEKNGNRVRELYYFDENFLLRTQRSEQSAYDVRQRRWFSTARQKEVTISTPYVFQYLQLPGKTYSVKLAESEIVLGIDITLQTFSNYLQNQSLSDGSEIYLYSATGEMLGSNLIPSQDEDLPTVQPLRLTKEERDYIERLGTIKISNQLDWPPIDFSVVGRPRGYAVDLIRLLSKMTGINVEFINGYSWQEITEKFNRGEIHAIHPVVDNEQNQASGYLTVPILRLNQTLVLREGSSVVTSIESIRGKTLALPKAWSTISIIKQAYPDIEIVEVSSTKEALEAVRDGKVFATIDSMPTLHYTAQQYFIRGLSFNDHVNSAKANLPKEFRLLVRPELAPLGRIMDKAIAAIGNEQQQYLQHKWLSAHGVAITPENFSTVPYESLISVATSSKGLNSLVETRIRDQQYFIYVGKLNSESKTSDYFAVVVPANTVMGESLEKVRLSILLTLGCLLLLLPIPWFLAELIVRPIHLLYEKSIQVKERRYNEIIHKPILIRELDDLSSSMVDMARAIEAYDKAQRDLMDSFIQLIADAIDEKSPYTGGHCRRVPELALKLVSKAAESSANAFKDFSFKSDDEYREFKTAAWLHDCGKITIPEHIVDKGSKLEVIYNRIHEVRMRFEVLWRDAEIVYWKALHISPEQVDALREELHRQHQQLMEEFEFIAKMNVGGEFLSDADQQRMLDISQRTWLRHFDDRLGLSPVEELRVQGGSRSLPAEEHLLADKPEHIIPRYRPMEFDPGFGIRMEVPENLYNLGEIYNLSISRGTLSAEDRFKINEHIISTIRMLEKLPFPKELKRVPRYASTHHETMKGTGYPRKLFAKDLSIPERIMVVADIFEALTAADRPYKKAKTIKESIEILHKMVLDNHVDRDVFELFLTSGVYQWYADTFLEPYQIDTVDISKYLQSKTELH